MYKLIFFFFVVANISIVGQAQDLRKIEYSPIGVFHSPYTEYIGAPRQGILYPKVQGEIKIFEEYRDALRDLEKFEYIIVLYHFHKTKTWENLVIPPGSNHSFGLFATRSPRRPNPIGFSIVKLERFTDSILFVSGIDAFNGSPVLDIKPYLPSIDCIKSETNSRTEVEYGHHDENFIFDSVFWE